MTEVETYYLEMLHPRDLNSIPNNGKLDTRGKRGKTVRSQSISLPACGKALAMDRQAKMD